MAERSALVFVDDADAERRADIEAIVQRAGGHVSPAPGGCILAVVAIERGQHEAIARCQPAAVPVIAYARDAHRWPLAERCRVLLSGVRDLVTWSADSPEALTAAVAREITAEAHRTAEESEIKTTLRDLGLVAESRAMLDIFRQVLRVSALSDVPAVITGETGTGKQLVAEALHQLDRKRRHGAFVPVNCAAVTTSLAEAEFFGHRRGAFTGADRDRKGLIKAADGGVLFLDELADLDLAVQAKLLRVLQDQRVLALGDERETPVSIRVIAATNHDLRSAVESGRFRQDLLQRLNVIAIHLPPLRERRDDIAPLVSHFLEKHRALGGGRPQVATPDFMAALTALDLPGNARQLENLVRSALVAAAGDPLTLRHLPADVWSRLLHDAPAGETRKPAPFIDSLLDSHPGSLASALQACERAILDVALQRAQGNQARTARMLGLTPRSIYNKLRRHRLSA